MLLTLSIRNVVLIERLDLSFKPGLCVLTGETGAGKSILLDALGLALGARVDPALIRGGPADGAAAVSAAFEIPPHHDAISVIEDHGLAPPGAGEPLILRRIVGTDGRSRGFVNEQPANAQLLRSIGETLVEIVGQFASHDLAEKAIHRSVLDRYGGLDEERNRVSGAWRAWRAVETALAEALAEAEAAAREEESLRHTLEELDTFGPREGEEDSLATARHRLRHAERLGETLSEALAEMTGNKGVEPGLARAHRVLARRTDIAGGMFDDTLEALDRAAAEAAEARAAIEQCAGELQADPGRLDSVEERLFALRALARKHGVAPDALTGFREETARKLAAIEETENSLSELRARTEAARVEYEGAAAALAAARRAAAKRLDAAVNAELEPLRLGTARFETEVDPLDERDWGPSGTERVTFVASTNPDTPAGPISRIASGGELSRFMLALKVVLAGASPVPTLVFDEVDAGIGGATSTAVGQRLRRLGEALQVLVVTHSPQVAALGGAHWRVRKREMRNRGGKETRTVVDELDRDTRREEIARMLAGMTVTDEARAAADSLIAGEIP